MPEPITIALLVVAVAGAAASAYSSVQAANAQADAARFNAKVARNNAIAEQQQLAFDMQRLKDRRKRVLAEQEARLATSGVRIDSGSAEALKIDQDVELRLDEIARHYGGRVGIGAQKSQAELFRAEAAQAKQQAVIGGTAAALGGLSGAAQTGIQTGALKTG